MDASAGPLTFWQALGALAPILGAGGISGIIIAVIGYMKAARDGQKPGVSPHAPVGIATLYAEQAVLQEAGQAIVNLARSNDRLAHKIDDASSRLTEKMERGIDEMRDLRRAVEDMRRE